MNMAATTPAKYRYKDLQDGEIRLLELELNSTLLTGYIKHWQTDAHPDFPRFERLPAYTALSHHWDPKPTNESELPVLMLIDPDDPSKKIKYELRLRQSLWDALQSIKEKMNGEAWRAKGWTRYIWVDAICINQCSTYDKDRQLGRMGDIYNDAEAVIIWLGLIDEETRIGFEFIKELQELSSLNTFLNDEKYCDNWKCLVMLIRKRWFQRLWIVQEIAAARDAIFLSGDQTVSWEDFASAWSIFVSQFEQVRTMLAKAGFFAKVRDPFGEVKLSGANILVENRCTLLRRRQDGGIAEHLRPLEYLLTSLSMFEVSEPHDIVYAVLWLSSDASQGRKRGYTMSHEFNVHTPLLEDNRSPKRQRLDDEEPQKENGGNLAEREPTVGWENTNGLTPNARPTHSRKPSISGQYLRLPATHAEQTQADEQMSAETGIKISYKQPVYDLCSQVLNHIIKTTQRLDIICFHWAPPPIECEEGCDEVEQEEDHPSWLLYLQRNAYSNPPSSLNFPVDVKRETAQLNPAHSRANAEPLIGKPGSNKRPYLACGRTRATHARIEGRVLQAYGYVLDKIVVDAGVATDAVIPWRWRRELGWTTNSELPPDKFWRTLIADKGPDDQPPPPRFRLACKWAFELGPKPPTSKRLVNGPNLNLEKVRNDGDGEAPLKEFLDCAIATVWNRKLFKTRACQDPKDVSPDTAFVGLGPQDLLPGDVVCVLWGCAVPVILRPLPKSTNGDSDSSRNPSPDPEARSNSAPTININDEPFRNSDSPARSIGKKRKRPLREIDTHVDDAVVEDYTFVGECYVHGMMNGEIFHWSDRHDKRIQDFHIH